MLRLAGLAFINGYQRYLSPRKGYRCAYGVLHQDGTCSSIGKNLMREHGVLGFFRLMPTQFAACKAAALALRQDDAERRARRETMLDRCATSLDVGELGCEAISCCECGAV